MKAFTFTVPSEDQGLSLLSFLKKEVDGHSVKALKRAIDAKCCEVNGHIENFSTHRIKSNDRIRLQLPLQKTKTLSRLYEDEFMLICNKDGQTVSEVTTLVSLLGTPVRLVHRLDKETSGAILLAKTEAMQEALETLFRERKIEKKYLAIVDKKVDFEEKCVRSLLAKVHFYQGMSLYGSGQQGKLAITEIKTLNKSAKASLLQCMPKTGRTHQIRIHLSELKYPILGDHLYGPRVVNIYRPLRHLLHASELQFLHPITGKEIVIHAPLPDDFLQAMRNLQLICKTS